VNGEAWQLTVAVTVTPSPGTAVSGTSTRSIVSVSVVAAGLAS
jgi:hypothetical protein